MTTTLTAKAKALVERPIIANVATVDARRPTPAHAGVDRHRRRRSRSSTRPGVGPRRTTSRRTPTWPCRWSTPTILTTWWWSGAPSKGSEDGADAHIDSLAKKYLGLDTYPMRQPGEVRVIYRVHADSVVMQASDA